MRFDYHSLPAYSVYPIPYKGIGSNCYNLKHQMTGIGLRLNPVNAFPAIAINRIIPPIKV
jgi:hypothetical protein